MQMENDNCPLTTYKNWSDFTWRLDELGIDLQLGDNFELKIVLNSGVTIVPEDVRRGLGQFQKDLHRFVLETDIARENRKKYHGVPNEKPATTVNKLSVFTD